jgi:hypothetical protein
MEYCRMDYRFTAILIIMLSLLAIFAEPAYPRNEYLNEYGVRCGEVDFRIEDRNRESDYRGLSSSDNESNEQNFSITFRKYLGTDCKTSKENVQLKQQLELMKMCNKVNKNPSLAYNENFALLVSKCRGVVPTNINEDRPVKKNLWKDLKKEYMEENPDVKTMDNTTLKKPQKDYKLPVLTND